jgi:hypothetical protein
VREKPESSACYRRCQKAEHRPVKAVQFYPLTRRFTTGLRHVVHGTQAAHWPGMSDKAFTFMVSQMVAESETEWDRELRVQHRHRLISVFRSLCVFLLVAAVIGCGIHYRTVLQQMILAGFYGQP